jgi:lipoprotein-releasing system ATP-binding protein
MSQSTIAAEAPVLLSARGVCKSYAMGKTRLDVLQGVDLDVREGEILAVLGKSGCGKSTLLHVLGWLDPVDRGSIHFEGRDRASVPHRERARLRNEVMGFVFQFYHLLPELTALENVLMPALIRHGRPSWRRHKKDELARAHDLLARVGLTARARHRPRHLSGGERQRVAIARALQNNPRFLFCDEPTGNLDGRTAEEIRDLLWQLNADSGQTMVVVTHDARMARQAHRIVHIEDGRAREGGSIDLVEEVERS